MSFPGTFTDCLPIRSLGWEIETKTKPEKTKVRRERFSKLPREAECFMVFCFFGADSTPTDAFDSKSTSEFPPDRRDPPRTGRRPRSKTRSRSTIRGVNASGARVSFQPRDGFAFKSAGLRERRVVRRFRPARAQARCFSNRRVCCVRDRGRATGHNDHERTSPVAFL